MVQHILHVSPAARTGILISQQSGLSWSILFLSSSSSSSAQFPSKCEVPKTAIKIFTCASINRFRRAEDVDYSVH